jgi:hypothetical protein
MPARKTPLRAVAPGETAAPKAPPKTVTQAARDGSARELMVAMRDRIAVAVENPNTPARDLAALTKRLAETVREIEAIDARHAEEARESVASPDEAWDAQAL